MTNKLQMPEIPEYVVYNMKKIAETGMDGLSLRDIGRLLIDWNDKYGDGHGGYNKCLETVEWLSENHEHFEQIRDKFIAN
ncbi:MAG: hypothetical protein O3C54_05335 [Proteobacteria bacterium]|nr:hypothetical protein [Pseudomonadota bacterium]MDA1056632.1 hypothetical protein [Pseudomonadota bacterium]